MSYSEKFKSEYLKNLGDTERHVALMFHYRLRTEPSHEMKFYIETRRYFEYGIKTEFLPDYIFTCNPIILKKDAYKALGKKLDE